MHDPAALPPRLPLLAPDELDPDQSALYRSITGGPRASGPKLFDLVDADGHLLGPFAAMLLSPPVGSALQALGAAVRYGSGLSDRIREMAILAVSARWGCDYELYAHEAVGRHIGLSADELAALRAGGVPELLDPAERAAMAAVAAVLDPGDLTDELYAGVVERLGVRGVFELTTLVGYYAALALQLRVFRVGAPPV